ncbi:MAG TPA: VWA domain-containing protein, partial [Pirellulales bacterium]|nr:VWA domain-containing protein [Pirellulales bacterium]
GYDLALGRAYAAKARCQGYDNMVATLKTDKFKDDKSTTWILDPSDEPTGNSLDDKMAAKAREYLNRVIKDHPGTPWASSAQRELEAPIGWKKSER